MQIVQGTMTLLPPRSDRCQTCGCAHEEAQPHNAQSLYYQTRFNMENGRAATWGDAMAHCSSETKRFWRHALMARGVDVDGGQVNPPRNTRAR